MENKKERGTFPRSSLFISFQYVQGSSAKQTLARFALKPLTSSKPAAEAGRADGRALRLLAVDLRQHQRAQGSTQGSGLPLEQAESNVVLETPRGRPQLLPQQVHDVGHPHEIRLAGVPRRIGRNRIRQTRGDGVSRPPG